MLKENTLFGIRDKVAESIKLITEHEPAEGYYVAFSGGKDSVCVYELMKMAGVKFDAHYHITTVDPPELVWFIRDKYPDVQRHRPKRSMWDMIERKMILPTRFCRYCCSELKETGGKGRECVVTGVRRAESAKRSRRRIVEKVPGGKLLHPILEWSDAEVWEFIHTNDIPYCSLYNKGFKRLGCLMCPLASKKIKKEKLNYIQSIESFTKLRVIKLWRDVKSLACLVVDTNPVLNGWPIGLISVRGKLLRA